MCLNFYRPVEVAAQGRSVGEYDLLDCSCEYGEEDEEGGHCEDAGGAEKRPAEAKESSSSSGHSSGVVVGRNSAEKSSDSAFSRWASLSFPEKWKSPLFL